jgi:glycosyltransferase involved in cell wall biosynthesis
MTHIVIDARGRQSSTGRYIDRLMEHLQQIDPDNRYTVLLEPGDQWEPFNPDWSAVECPYRRFSFNPLDLVTQAWFIKRLKPDLVHFSMTPQEPVWSVGPRVTTTHDLTMLRFTRSGKYSELVHRLRMLGYRFRFWHSHRAARHVIVPTHFVAEDLIRLHPFAKDKITVTYEASEPPLDVSAKKPEKVKQPFIFHVGSPFPHKNIERLCEAFTILKEKHPDLQLILPGKREQYFEKLEALIGTHPYRGSIIIPGFVSDEELKWLYQNAEAYVLPSLSEGFGLPGLEAMTHGCPLVSSNATCLPEVYGEAAHYFDPESVQDMADKIDQVISSEKRRKALIKEGYVQLKKYSWQHMAEQTLEVYDNVLQKNKYYG